MQVFTWGYGLPTGHVAIGDKTIVCPLGERPIANLDDDRRLGDGRVGTPQGHYYNNKEAPSIIISGFFITVLAKGPSTGKLT